MLDKAEDGGTGSAYRLAQLFEIGGIVKPDPERSFKYARQAAIVGHTRGMVLLGQYYFAGHGVRSDHQAAQYWYEEAFRLQRSKTETALSKAARLDNELSNANRRLGAMKEDLAKLRRNVRHVPAATGPHAARRRLMFAWLPCHSAGEALNTIRAMGASTKRRIGKAFRDTTLSPPSVTTELDEEGN